MTYHFIITPTNLVVRRLRRRLRFRYGRYSHPIFVRVFVIKSSRRQPRRRFMSVYNIWIQVLKDEAGVRNRRGWDIRLVFPQRRPATRHRTGVGRRSVPHIQQTVISSHRRGARLGFLRLGLIEESISPCRLIIDISVFYARSD